MQNLNMRARTLNPKPQTLNSKIRNPASKAGHGCMMLFQASVILGGSGDLASRVIRKATIVIFTCNLN